MQASARLAEIERGKTRGFPSRPAMMSRKEGLAVEEYETVGVYQTAPEAYIALGRLRAEGFKARILDEHIVRAVAVGGIKLQVVKRHVESARKVLATDYSKDLDW
jgi:hypothetical protein